MIRFVFVLAVFLAARGATEIKALSPTDTAVAKALAKTTLNQPVNNTLRIVPFQGKYLIYSTEAKMVFKNDSLLIPIIGTLNYISPLIPQQYWVKAYKSKKLEIDGSTKIWLEFDHWLPLLKRSVISHQGLLINKKMFYITSFEKNGEELPGWTFLFFIIFYAVGLLAEGVKWIMKKIEVSMDLWILALIILAFGIFLLFSWLALIFAIFSFAFGLAMSYLIAKWLRKKRKKILGINRS